MRFRKHAGREGAFPKIGCVDSQDTLVSVKKGTSAERTIARTPVQIPAFYTALRSTGGPVVYTSVIHASDPAVTVR